MSETRVQLKARFSSGQRIGESDFAALIDSLAHASEDLTSNLLASGVALTEVTSDLSDLTDYAETLRNEFDEYKGTHSTETQIRDWDDEVSAALSTALTEAVAALNVVDATNSTAITDLETVVSNLDTLVTGRLTAIENEIAGYTFASDADLAGAVDTINQALDIKSNIDHTHPEYLTADNIANFITMADIPDYADRDHFHVVADIVDLEGAFTTEDEVLALIDENKLQIDIDALIADGYYSKGEVDQKFIVATWRTDQIINFDNDVTVLANAAAQVQLADAIDIIRQETQQDLDARDAQMRADFAEADNTVRTDLVAADDQLKVNFEAADAQIVTDFTAADAQVSADFAAADDAVRAEFAAADDTIRTEFADADAATQANLNTSLTAIRNDFGAADTTIKEALEAEDASIRSDFTSADTAISNAYQAADTANKDALDAVDAQIRADFEAEDASIRTDFTTADTDITNEFRLKDTQMQTAYEAEDASIREDFTAADTAINDNITQLQSDVGTLNNNLAQSTSDLDTNLKAYTDQKITDLIGGASAAYDTLKEIQTLLENGDTAAAVSAQLGEVQMELGGAFTEIDNIRKWLGRTADELAADVPEASLTSPASIGQDTIQVDLQSIFKVGDEIVIEPGTANSEIAIIKEFGSLVLVDPLTKSHPNGSKVVLRNPLISSITSLSGASSASQEELDALVSSVETLSASVTTLQSDLATSNTTIQTLQDDLATSNTTIQTLQDDLVAANTSITTLNDSVDAANATITTLQTDLESANTLIGDLQDQVASLEYPATSYFSRYYVADGYEATYESGYYTASGYYSAGYAWPGE